MKKIINWFMIQLFGLGLFLLPISGYGADPEITNLIVTDVTPVSFSVVWTASEPSQAGMEIFRDVNGYQTATEAVITAHPLDSGDAGIQEALENNGIMKVRVTGLSPDTIYFFKTVTTSKDGSDPGTASYPSAAPFPHVVTQGKTSRVIDLAGSLQAFTNDILVKACLLEDGMTPAEGTLLLAYVHGCQFPLSGAVGDGISSPFARIDLNNAFSGDSFQNIWLAGKESVFLVQYMGIQGQIKEMTGLPCNDMQGRIREAEFKGVCQGDFTGDAQIGEKDVLSFSEGFAHQYDQALEQTPVWGDIDRDGQVDGRDIAAMADLAANGNCPTCQ